MSSGFISRSLVNESAGANRNWMTFYAEREPLQEGTVIAQLFIHVLGLLLRDTQQVGLTAMVMSSDYAGFFQLANGRGEGRGTQCCMGSAWEGHPLQSVQRPVH